MSTMAGHHEGLTAAAEPAAGDGFGSAAPGYAARRTMPLRVELRRQLKRRRTQFAFGFLVLLPFLLMAAFELGSNDSTGGGAASFVDLATTGAANFTIFTIFASTGFLLVVIVALFAGDTVASEASWSATVVFFATPVFFGADLGAGDFAAAPFWEPTFDDPGLSGGCFRDRRTNQ